MIKIRKQTVNNAKWESPQYGLTIYKHPNTIAIQVNKPKTTTTIHLFRWNK